MTDGAFGAAGRGAWAFEDAAPGAATSGRGEGGTSGGDAGCTGEGRGAAVRDAGGAVAGPSGTAPLQYGHVVRLPTASGGGENIQSQFGQEIQSMGESLSRRVGHGRRARMLPADAGVDQARPEQRVTPLRVSVARIGRDTGLARVVVQLALGQA